MAAGWLAAGWPAGVDAAEDPVSRLVETPVARIEPGLPGVPFGDWLRGLLPPGTLPVFRTGPCPEGPGRCVSVEVAIPSRTRTLGLDFAFEPVRFLGGTLEVLGAAPQPPIGALSKLPERLVAPIRPRPLACPEGARLTLRESPDGLNEWCTDPGGVRHGPARSWFSAGRHLMARGRYEHGERSGSWIECDRSERCQTRDYP